VLKAGLSEKEWAIMSKTGRILACRVSVYGKFMDGAYTHLHKVGVKGVEIDCPEKEEAGAVLDEVHSYGLEVTSVVVRCNLADDDAVDTFCRQMDIVRDLGAGIIFTSMNSAGLDRELVYSRLRQIGDRAAQYNIRVALETHPDLVTNGDIGRETMEAVDHEHIRINYDTANVYFYNRNIDSVTELRKLAPYVASVHIKDGDGRFRSASFGTIGEGIVDFPQISDVLDEVGFAGPVTLEPEGIAGEELIREDMYKRIADSVSYLRRIGFVE